MALSIEADELQEFLAGDEATDKEEQFSLASTSAPEADHVSLAPNQYTILELYSVAGVHRKNLFRYDIFILNGNAPVIKVRAIFDSGAVINAMCAHVFDRIKHRLSGWEPHETRLRVANGQILKTAAKWTGSIQIENITVEGSFMVFDSGGGWDFIVGNPLMENFRAVHDFGNHSVTIKGGTEKEEGEHVKLYSMGTAAEGTYEAEEVHAVDQCTRFKPEGPFFPPRIDRIKSEVSIGDDVSPAQREEVLRLVEEFADIFALSVREVGTVQGATHRLQIPEDKSFPLKVHQKPLTPPQRAWYNKKIDEMLTADIIEPIHARDVRFVAPTVLAKKAHEGAGWSVNRLKRKVEEQCRAAGLEPMFKAPAAEEGDEEEFEQALNKFTEIAPMPQGDIREKQQRLSGHGWISTFDFASGFYAVELEESSSTFVCFYVEGRGYFAYKQMPFGLTGAPSEFATLTAVHLHDLVMDSVLEIFVDNGGTAADVFEEGMARLRAIFQRAWERNLSISASKLNLFMTTAVFAGAQVGKEGVRPDLAKLTAIVNWDQPKIAQQLESFLGLTGWFLDLIAGYAKIESPLRDLLKPIAIPKDVTKAGYR